MVRQSTRTSLVIVLILFVAFNILSMVEGKRHQVRHQCQNNHESHQHCPNPKHHTGANRKKRSDLSTMNPMLLNKNHTFDIFYDNSKFDERDIPFLRQIYHEKPWKSESKRENYLEDLEKIFGRFPQNVHVRRIEKSLEPAKNFNRKFLRNENIEQILNNLEEEESPNHIRVKRDNSKFKQGSSPSMSSEYLQNLAESFAGPSEAEEKQDIDTKEIENDEKKIQNPEDIRKRDVHQNSLTIRNKHRPKRDRDPDEFKIQNHGNNHRSKKGVLNNKNNHSKNKKSHKNFLKMGLTKRHAKNSNRKVIKEKPNKEKKKKKAEKKSITENKNKSSRVEKNRQHQRKNKRNLKNIKNLKKNKNRIGKLRRERRHDVRETNDLYGSLKSSSSLEEIKNLAENLISKIDHLGESIKRHRIKRNSHELSSNVHSKDNSIS